LHRWTQRSKAQSQTSPPLYSGLATQTTLTQHPYPKKIKAIKILTKGAIAAVALTISLGGASAQVIKWSITHLIYRHSHGSHASGGKVFKSACALVIVQENPPDAIAGVVPDIRFS